MTVIITDMLPWTAWIRYCHHSHTRCSHHDYKDRSQFSHSHSCPCNHRYRSSSCQDPTEVTPGHSTDLPAIVSHITGAPVPTATTMTHLTTDLHLIGILPKMTADLNINPKSNTTDQPTDPRPLCKHQLGNIRIRDISKLLSMTHHQSTTAQMIMAVIQRMI